MLLTGKLWKDGKFWVIEAPLLDLTTQGHTKKEALMMIGDAIEGLVNKKRFKTHVSLYSKDEFTIDANDKAELLRLMLIRNRHKHGLSLEDMRECLGFSSKTSYAQYEQGKKTPRIDQIEKFLRAMDPTSELVLFSVARNQLKEVA